MKKIHIKEVLAKPALALAALAAVGGGAGVAALASAQTTTPTTQAGIGEIQGRHMPGVMGEITAINGSTLTVLSHGFGQNAAETTYTVDVSNATVMKAIRGNAPTTSSVSALAVGDKVGIEGTVSGTSVVATRVMSGDIGGPGFGHGGRGHGTMGTVSAVNGTTLTITREDGTTSTVEAANATVSKVVDVTISDIKVGDRINAEGSTSGTTVTANRIMTGIPQRPADANTAPATQQ